MKCSIDVWSLNQESKELRGVVILEEFLVLSFDDLNVEISGFGLNDSLSCNKYVLINKELVSFSLVKIISHIKSLCTGTGLIKERGITDLKAGKLFDNSLIVKKGLESALRDFGLIGGVWSVPKVSRNLPVGVLQDVSGNDRGSDAGVVTVPDVVLEQFVLTHHFFEVTQILILRQRFSQGLPIEAVRVPDDFGDGLLDQLLNAVNTT
jgi:hypothetical protein